MTDIAPVHSLVSMVMEELGAPVLLLPPNASPHHYALRPSDAGALEQADLVVWVGHALTPWLEKPVTQLADDALSVELIDYAPTLIELKDDGHNHGHDHGDGVDPHAWLDPQNAEAWLGEIAGRLADLDPENAVTYRRNAETAQQRIATLGRDIAADLVALQKQSYAVDHDAYRYFEARFGLKHRFAITDSHASDPGPARIAELRDSVRSEGLDCIFTQGKENSGLLETVIEGHHAKVVEIDPIGVDLSPGPLLYMDLMHNLSTSMTSC